MTYLLLSSFLDILLSTNIINSYQNINYFFPIILVSAIPISYILIKNKTIFFISIIIISILYDLLYSDIVLLNLYYFLLISLFINIFYTKNKPSLLNILLISILSSISYDIYIAITLILIDYHTINIFDIIYKTSHSLILSISYIIISLITLKSRIFGHQKSFNK